MRKRGFTLVELLVVFSIIAVSIALALPAIQRATQDARRATCKNRLKEIGLALMNYHDVYNTFPPGWISRDGSPGFGARLGWQVSILPFVNQAVLYNEIDFSQTSPIAANGKPLALFQTPLDVFRCPADQTADNNPWRGEYATSNYTGNYGHLPPPRLRPLGLSDFWPGAVPAPMKSRGIFARNSSIALGDIPDGSTNTLLVSERCLTSGSAIWAGVTDNAHEDDAVTDCSHRSRPNAGWFSFSSRHGGGVNILLCDGSARFLNDGVDSKPGPEPGILQMLGGRDDGRQFELK